MIKLETINERVKAVRKEIKETQADFAKRLNLTGNYISLMEKGQYTPSDRTISDICREFSADEHWLRTGEGEMFRPKDKEEEVFSWVGSVLGKPDDDIRKKLLTAFASVPEDKWELLEEFVKSLQK